MDGKEHTILITGLSGALGKVVEVVLTERGSQTAGPLCGTNLLKTVQKPIFPEWKTEYPSFGLI